jgi:hypothetical protein
MRLIGWSAMWVSTSRSQGKRPMLFSLQLSIRLQTGPAVVSHDGIVGEANPRYRGSPAATWA